MPETTSTQRFPWRRTLAILIIIAVCAGICAMIIKTGPKATRRPPAPMQANVKVRPLERTNEQIVVSAMGSVIPQRSISLTAQVNGEVLELGPDFAEGNHLAKGDFILKIDDRDYQTALASAQATLDLELSDMAIESGNQTIAKREWELIQEASEIAGVDSSLALRQPQLKSAEAEVAMARASLEQAEINLQRTRIVAPFNAIVLEKNVDIGSYVSTQTTVASLAGIDTYWVRAAVPKTQLKWLTIPGPTQSEGSEVRVFPNASQGTYRTGKIISLLGDLDPEGRMARVLIAVEDPLSLLAENEGQPPLLLGDYVSVEILGKELQNIYSLPRLSFRDGARVWLASDKDQLEIRPITPVWQGDDFVIVDEGLADGERLVVSNLSMPTPGLKLVVADEDGKLLSAELPPEKTGGDS
ncbi:efflux RND transporter periplasmic adaptor subunit [Cerasicoccus fimbriatus]|uniref:efflux RND transporter periplasmic adaptor subunit n=1 Tax=Cerasicoccus fimbriatus TaxID=3014554 RepID=UPI0022B42AB7|nr:efflux RND transporter periplasmic adaptor subunit [Cerasicoccus sp. TK19100]